MKDILSNDSNYKRLKDGMLLLLAGLGVYSWLVRPVAINEQIQSKLLESSTARAKYIPIIERNDERLTKLEVRQEEQFARIMNELQAINRKLNR